MHEHMQNLCDTLDYVYRDLAKVNRQVRDAGGELNPSNMEYIDKLTHTIKSLETTKAMKEASEDQGRGEYGARGDRGGYGMRYPGGYYPGSMYPVGGYRDGYADGGMRDGYGMRGGYRDGYGRNQDRDAAGRYADDMGMRDKLRTMMANTRDENTRQEIQRMMDTMA